MRLTGVRSLWPKRMIMSRTGWNSHSFLSSSRRQYPVSSACLAYYTTEQPHLAGLALILRLFAERFPKSQAPHITFHPVQQVLFWFYSWGLQGSVSAPAGLKICWTGLDPCVWAEPRIVNACPSVARKCRLGWQHCQASNTLSVCSSSSSSPSSCLRFCFLLFQSPHPSCSSSSPSFHQTTDLPLLPSHSSSTFNQ